MKQKIINAVDELKNLSGNQEKTIKFEHHASLQKKTVKGEVTLSKEGTINLLLTEIEGYNPNYINKVANSFFKYAILSEPTTGSILWTKSDNITHVIGQIYTLNNGSYYYGVGENPYIDCNGSTLFENVQGEYQGEKPGSCKPGSGRKYKLFKIV
ncbi:hypothetical protein [Flavobacterium collinsii]|uniref:Uncharacterized protein n=1 Tax=Flavobacterium collinsii TaxID=1114861 RepID=A0A9W4TKX8_9FLAO|nr:hypothetical protein [Flavobacterium collinsii]CAI2768701.1 protein of unknown function [Flavobacterium collinsii]